MKKKILSLVFAFFLIIPASFMFTACSNKDDGMYKIKYIVDGHVYAESLEGKAVYEYEIPTKAGHEFAGWYLDGNFTIPFVPDNHLQPDKIVVLYGKFIETELYVTFCYHLAGGKNSEFNSVKEYLDDEQNIKLYDPIKENATFGGWFINEECTIEFDEFICVNALDCDKVVCVYAKWINEN